MKILICRMTAGGLERAELGSCVALWSAAAPSWPGVEDVLHLALDVCPTPVARNQAVKAAREAFADVLVSIDADTVPDAGFLKAALGVIRERGPCVVAAPYVCAGPEQRVQVFRWGSNEDATGNDALGRCVHVSRDEAARLSGAEDVAFFGTGCFAAHIGAFDRIAPPYFAYEYEDATMTKVVSTEDVRCFRDLSLAGVPMVCLWDHWAVHMKTVPLGRPLALAPGDVAERTRRFLAESPKLPPLKGAAFPASDEDSAPAPVARAVPQTKEWGVGTRVSFNAGRVYAVGTVERAWLAPQPEAGGTRLMYAVRRQDGGRYDVEARGCVLHHEAPAPSMNGKAGAD